MDAKLVSGEQRDQQVEASVEQAMRGVAEGLLKETHTCLPGIVAGFDAETQTAQVRPAIKRVFAEVGPVDLPACVDVPVCFPAGGDFVLTFPVAAGDECLLVFSERAIDFWWEKGGVQLPSEYRLHDYSDAFALVGVSSKARKLSGGVSTSAVQLRSRGGDVIFHADNDGITLGGEKVPSLIEEPVILGNKLKAFLLGVGIMLPDTGPSSVFSTKVKVRP